MSFVNAFKKHGSDKAISGKYVTEVHAIFGKNFPDKDNKEEVSKFVLILESLKTLNLNTVDVEPSVLYTDKEKYGSDAPQLNWKKKSKELKEYLNEKISAYGKALISGSISAGTFVQAYPDAVHDLYVANSQIHPAIASAHYSRAMYMGMTSAEIATYNKLRNIAVFYVMGHFTTQVKLKLDEKFLELTYKSKRAAVTNAIRAAKDKFEFKNLETIEAEKPLIDIETLEDIRYYIKAAYPVDVKVYKQSSDFRRSNDAKIILTHQKIMKETINLYTGYFGIEIEHLQISTRTPDEMEKLKKTDGWIKYHEALSSVRLICNIYRTIQNSGVDSLTNPKGAVRGVNIVV